MISDFEAAEVKLRVSKGTLSSFRKIGNAI